MRFSVIVPCYNVEKYVQKCIDSILDQTFTDFEVILVNDGSLDRTRDILDEYANKDKRVVVIHKENGGSNSARKAAARIAKGEYIICIDGDDWISPEMLMLYSNLIDEFGVEVICCGYYKADSKGVLYEHHPEKIHNQYGYFDREAIEDYLFPKLFSFSPSLCFKTFKKDVYIPAQLSLDDVVEMGEDRVITYVSFYRIQSIYVLDKCLYYYRFNPMSMTRKRKRIVSSDGASQQIKCFENALPLDKYGFQNQLNEYSIHVIANVVKSIFSNMSYKQAIFQTNRFLSENNHYSYVEAAIKSSDYRMRIISFFLLHRFYLAFKVWTMICG